MDATKEQQGLRNRFAVSAASSSTATAATEAKAAQAPADADHNQVGPEKIDLWFSMRCHLERITLVEQTFDVDGWINFLWADKHIMEPGKGGAYVNEKKGMISIEDDGENQPINLKAMFENAIKTEMVMDPVFRYNAKTGVVQETIHFKATFVEAMEIDKFPFDRQYLTMRVCVRTKEFRCLMSPPEYVPDRLNMRDMVSYTYSPVISDWITHRPVVGRSSAAGQSDDFRIAVSFRVERDNFFWLFNYLFDVFLIVLLSNIAFMVKMDAFADRVGIVLTLLLTLVTFKAVLSSNIPRSSTVTLLDKYMMLSYFMLIFVVFESIMGLLLVDEAHWRVLDLAAVTTIVMFWVSLHIWIVSTVRRGGFSIPWDELKDEGAGSLPVHKVGLNDIDSTITG